MIQYGFHPPQQTKSHPEIKIDGGTLTNAGFGVSDKVVVVVREKEIVNRRKSREDT